VAGDRTSRIRRAFAPFLLVILQAHLLVVAMLHQHGETTAPRHSLCVSANEVQPSPDSKSNLLCTVCQIVHNGAVQRASAAQILPPSNSLLLLRRLATSHYRSELPALSYGRAPPLL
jgi:hypothetical protein